MTAQLRSVVGSRLLRYPVLLVGLALLMAAPFYLEPGQMVPLSFGLALGVAALGFNLLLGYSGLLSFGHAAFFGAGLYGAAYLASGRWVVLVNAIAAPFYGAVGLNWTALPISPLNSMELMILGGLGAAAFFAALFGFLAVRHTRIFFSILTLALAQVLYSLILKLWPLTNGTDGIRVQPPPTLLGIDFLSALRGQDLGIPAKLYFDTHIYYYYLLGVFVLAALAMWVIVNSPFGKALQAIRDNETRAAFVGIPIRRYRWYAFVISGVFTGLGGAVFAPVQGIAAPDQLYWTFSGKIVFMTILGGFTFFGGPVLGAIVYQYLESYAQAATVYWQFVLGVVLVALILVLPAGLLGARQELSTRISRIRNALRGGGLPSS